jgi:hypothetical protein
MKRVLRREGPRVPLSNGSAQPSAQIGMAAMSHQPGGLQKKAQSTALAAALARVLVFSLSKPVRSGQN